MFANKNIKEITISRISTALSRRIRNIPHQFLWDIKSTEYQINKEKLLKYKNIYKGERCFVVANGPSLKKMDLSLLKNEITIGMNRIFLMKEINGFMPNYLVVADIDIQLKQFTNEYDKVEIPRFYNWNTRKLFTPSENLMFFKESFQSIFQPDFTKKIGTGKSVSYTCLQLAYFMGFSEVILIGKDHNYNIIGIPHSTVKSSGQEENHFIKGYYKEGTKWDVPDYLGEEYAYSLAKTFFENDNRKIYDATLNGKLTIFEKKNFETFFK